MSILLTERPYIFGFTKNEARYVFNVTNPLSIGCAVEIKLFVHEIQYPDSPAELITSVKLYPSPDGTVTFYANDYLDSLLTVDLPAPGSTVIKNAYNQQLYYWIEYRQVTSILPNNLWVITERTRKRVMMPGGIEVQKYERNNFFENYLIPGKKWLTWLPSNKFVKYEQEHYLSWLRTVDALEAPRVLVYVHYTNGDTTNKTINIAEWQKSYLFHIPTGVKQLGLDALFPDKKIHYYDVIISDNIGGVLTETYTFYIDYDQQYNWFDWSYMNSISGIDSIRIRGEFTREINRDATEASKITLLGNLNEQVKQGDRTDTSIILSKKWKGDVGYLNTPEEQNALIDMLASTGIFENIDSRWVKVQLLTKTFPLAASDDTKWNFPIEWNYSYDNCVFTPDAQFLGNGTNGEAYDPLITSCNIPSDLTANVGPDVSGITVVEFTWTHAGTSIIKIECRKVGDTAWNSLVWFKPSDYPPGTFYSATFVSDGQEYEWRAKAVCLNEDESTWNNGANFIVADAAVFCALPSALNVIKGDSYMGMIPFTFSWYHPLPHEFILEYRKITGGAWTSVTVTDTNTIIQFPDDGSEYEWKVKAHCENDTFSTSVYGVNFTSDSSVSCALPYNLEYSKTAETAEFATYHFSWNHPSAINFIFQYKYSSDFVWNTLTPAVNYLDIVIPKKFGILNWRVAAKCSDTDFSAYAYGISSIDAV